MASNRPPDCSICRIRSSDSGSFDNSSVGAVGERPPHGSAGTYDSHRLPGFRRETGLLGQTHRSILRHPRFRLKDGTTGDVPFYCYAEPVFPSFRRKLGPRYVDVVERALEEEFLGSGSRPERRGGRQLGNRKALYPPSFRASGYRLRCIIRDD